MATNGTASSDGPTYELGPELESIKALARETAEQFRDKSLFWEETGTFPWPNIRALAERGLLGASVPEEYGGGGGDWLTGAVILEEIGRCCYVTGMAALGEIGVQTRAIAAFGSDEQKQKYLPAVASGDLILAVCITEPNTGSDVRQMSTVARNDGDGLVVNGAKTLISRADVAGLFVVYVRLVDDGNEIAAVLVERDTPGFSVAQTFETLGGENLYGLTFDNVRLGAESVLVRKDGFRNLMSAFNGQRCMNAAISIGIAQGAQDLTIAQARARTQGGSEIGSHQGIRWMIADNAIEIEAARALVHRAASRAGQGFPSRYEAAVAKTFANEMALRVTDRCLQIFGGHGWTREMGIERYLRWARYGPLGGGTPQIQRNGIARQLLGPVR